MQNSGIVYELVLKQGDVIRVDAKILAYFKTLSEMVTDFPNQEAMQIPVPEEDQPISREMLLLMGSFYREYTLNGIRGVEDVLDEEYHRDVALNTGWNEVKDDEGQLVALVIVSDYLRADEFYNFVKARLYETLHLQTTEALEERCAPLLLKRKVTDCDAYRTVRIQYRREELICRVMETLLPDALVRPVDKRIRKYAASLVGQRDNLIIRYGTDSVFQQSDYSGDRVTEPESILSLERGRQALSREKVNDIVAGSTYYALLNDKGILSVFGEYDCTVYTWKSLVATEKPLGNTACHGIWGGERLFYVTTGEALYVCGNIRDRLQECHPISPGSVLEISVGNNHALILTSEGLYDSRCLRTYDDTEYRPHGIDKFNYTTVKLNVLDEEIELIWSCSNHDMVVTKTGLLYARGYNHSGQLGLRVEQDQGTYLRDGIGRPVDLTNLPPGQKVRLITGDEYRTIIVIGNQLYHTGRDQHRNEHPRFVAMPEQVSGDIIDVVSYPSSCVLVATTLGIYLFEHLGVNKHLFQLGGSSSPSSPYLLNIPFGLLLIDEEEPSEPNKKQCLGHL